MTVDLTVVLCTHGPNKKRLSRTLSALKGQSLGAVRWELILVDNGSQPPIQFTDLELDSPANTRIVVEPRLGLTTARRRGFSEARGSIIVMVDDDNELASDYLANVIAIFEAHPTLGAIGGRVVPEFEHQPAEWMREFDSILACRDYGPASRIAAGVRPSAIGLNRYPAYAPIGAGMAIRTVAVQRWLADEAAPMLSDRRGDELTSAGDNDIVFSISLNGWDTGYFPQLTLTHLIAAERTTAAYLARLNRGIQRSWIQLLRKHNANPWPAISPWTVPARKAKAWLLYRAWSSPAAHVRWCGACGHFEGRAL